jgi:aryl-alcohol dehydrogenase-like predicted oxidoreductase
MKYKRLGRAGVKVSELCLGTMIYGRQVEEDASIKIIRRAIDLGINFIDTADAYVGGLSETIVGKAIKGMRDDIVLATKVYNRMGPNPNDMGLSRKHISKAIEDSLNRLGTDYIDVYQVHRFDSTTPLRETLSTLTDLVHQGKVHYLGCSNYAAWQIEKALRLSDLHKLEAFSSSQPRYNLLDRAVEREQLPLCLEEGIGVIPFSPLAGGFLTGKYQPDAPMPEGSRGQLRPDWMKRYQTDRNLQILRELRSVSEETGLKMSQISLAWLLYNPAITAPIIGASRIEQLEENVEVVDRPLPDYALQRINDVSKPEWLLQQEARRARTRR